MRPSLIGFSPRQQAVIVAEAHKRGKPVQTHATSSEGLRLAVEAGIDLIQHPEMMSRDLPDDLIHLIVTKGSVLRHARQLDHRASFAHAICRSAADAEARIAKMPPPATTAEQWRRVEMLQETQDIQRRNAVRLISAGCKVTPATDSYLGDAPEFRRTAKTDELEPGSGTIISHRGVRRIRHDPNAGDRSGYQKRRGRCARDAGAGALSKTAKPPTSFYSTRTRWRIFIT